MKYLIDFSIYSTPVSAYGNATGEMAYSPPPVPGQFVELFDGLRLQIMSIRSLDGRGGRRLLGLADAVLESEEDARVLATRLTTELDFFVMPYHDG